MLKRLADEWYQGADKIVLVMDNLNTHTVASLYKRYPPAEAKRIIDRFEIHYTPKHGSWLNIAEIGLNLLTKQCVNRRIPEITTLRRELEVWCAERNKKHLVINWQFKTDGRCTS